LISKILFVKYRVITEDAFNRITSFFDDLRQETKHDYENDLVEILYEIRIGNETYSGPSFDEFKRQYQKKYKADYIRIIIQATSVQQQLNPVNANVTLLIDRSGISSFQVLGRNNNWVNGVFNRFNEILNEVPKRNVVLHNIIFEMSMQLLAVIVMTIFSIYVANKVSGLVNIEYSTVYIFIVIFLLLSNLWTYASRGLISVRTKFYPLVDIIKTPRKPILLAVLAFIILAIASWAVGYILNLLFIKQ
jgi:hypothetical protein